MLKMWGLVDVTREVVISLIINFWKKEKVNVHAQRTMSRTLLDRLLLAVSEVEVL